MTTQRFITIKEACTELRCRLEWVDYAIRDGLVETRPLHPIDGAVKVDIQALRQLDSSDFIVVSWLAAARFNCARQRIDALIREGKLRAFRQGPPGKRPTLLVRLCDVVELMKVRRWGQGKKKDGA